jgi:hypothetical protein
MMTKWQSIETAPRDETEILILTTMGVTSARFYDGVWTRTMDGDDYVGPVWSCCDDAWVIEVEELPITEENLFGYYDEGVTHWMPLPEPPK